MTEPKFDPIREIKGLGDSVGRFLEQGIQSVTGGIVQPRIDIYELDQQVIIRTSPLDGIAPESIEVSMEGRSLTISGETKPDDTPRQASYILQERRFGRFSRTVEIPLAVRAEEARAQLRHSVLTVTLPIEAEGDIPITLVQ